MSYGTSGSCNAGQEPETVQTNCRVLRHDEHIGEEAIYRRPQARQRLQRVKVVLCRYQVIHPR